MISYAGIFRIISSPPNWVGSSFSWGHLGSGVWGTVSVLETLLLAWSFPLKKRNWASTNSRSFLSTFGFSFTCSSSSLSLVLDDIVLFFFNFSLFAIFLCLHCNLHFSWELLSSFSLFSYFLFSLLLFFFFFSGASETELDSLSEIPVHSMFSLNELMEKK